MVGAGERSKNALWTAALLLALVSVAGIAALDGFVARSTATLSDGGMIWSGGAVMLDSLLLRNLSHFLLGATLMLAAGLLLLIPATRATGFSLLYVGVVQFFTTLIADFAGSQFGRLPPSQSAAGGDNWFVGAGSFPSGQAAFYAGLFFPLIRLFPRATVLWILPPLYVAAARVLGHFHYLSDVSASLALAAALAAGLSFLADKGEL
ncbi:MAG: phosphatase PAP2 family protein [Pseudomonadota bacterium]|nr:phosphatase PAP2 family protein [Pseudomonadota bacterium]